jgi:cell division protein FtsA
MWQFCLSVAFKAEDVHLIVEARVEELFEYVDKELRKIQRSRKLPGGVVLVGGTAKLPGIAEFAKEQLQLPARLGKLETITGLVDTVADPSYATAVGLMLLDMVLPAPENGDQRGQYQVMGSINSVFDKLGGFLKRR